MLRQLEEAKEALKAAEEEKNEYARLIPVVATPNNVNKILDDITNHETEQAQKDIDAFTEERKQQAVENIKTAMRKFFPNWEPQTTVESATQEATTNIEKQMYWQAKINELPESKKKKAMQKIGDDWDKPEEWEMIKLTYDDFTD